MSVKRPGSALSSGAESLEPIDSKDLQKSITGGQFASQLDALETAAASGGDGADGAESVSMQSLRQIASNADLSTPGQALAAIRESARYLINSRINEKFRKQEKVNGMIEELSDFVADDPFLGMKLKKILERLKKK
ncbi:MAG: hypothetical protein ABI954_12700 [Pyrinomonadaceae bacterium]